MLPALGWYVLAQQQATLTGTVSDTSAALIPGARVTLVNAASGEEYGATTNEVGSYTIPFVKPGTYLLSAEAEGFKKSTRSNMRLDTASYTRADLSLELGDVTETVTVEADVPLLKTENSSVGSVIQNKTIANMPLLGRRAAQLVRLSGFVVQTGTGSQFQIAGGRSNNAMWTLDGGSTQNILLGVASLNFDPPIEALEEMNVEVSNYKAEMGRSGGGFIQMTTKAGTNNFHGALYEFIRNDAMDSRQFFAASKQKLRRNQYGFALGGPIKRNRSFFFVSHEWTPQTTANPRIENIPAPAETRGDFSGLRTAIRDPETRQPVPGNIIPASQIDPVGLAAAGFWPAPNIDGRPSRNRNYLGLATTKGTPKTLSVRLDHSISDRHRVFGRYVHNLNTNNENFGIWPDPVHNDARIVRNEYYNWSVTGISNVSPTLVTEYRFTWNKRKFHPIIAAKGLGLAQQIGFQGGDPEFFPGFGFSGGIQRIGRGGGQERRQFPIRDNHIVNNWTKVLGSHTLKWGGEFRWSTNDDENLPTAGGNMSFNNNATGDPVAALLYGWVASGARQQTLLVRSRANSMGMYLQDDWKVSRKLTLNLGLRYDLDTPRFEAIDNRQNSFDTGAVNPVCDCLGLVTWSGRNARGGSKYAHNFVYGNLGPRLGFAYRPMDGWVIRGGASIVYTGQYDQATPIVANAGFAIQGNFGTLRPTDAAFRLRDGLPALAQPSEADLVPGFGAVAIGKSPVFAPQFFEPENRPNPYLLTYNLNVQKQLPKEMLFEVGYLSTLGRKLTIPGTATLNQIHPNQIALVDTQRIAPQVLRPFPQFSNVTMIAPTWGASEYHGVNFRLEKRYSNGLQFSMNYTFARAIDNVEGRNELAGEDGNAPFANQYDRAQAWSLGGSHIQHRFITAGVWDVPVGRGRKFEFGSGLANQVLGGWTLGTVIEARTGPPFSAYWGNASQIYPTAARVRADAVKDYAANPDWRSNVRGAAFFDTSGFARPARFTFGTVGRNAFIGPGALRADLSLIKQIRMPWENHSLEFRGEVINFPNRANFATPNQNLQAANFGTVTGLTAGASGRIVQLGLRYAF
ncbi:MAG: TonB-dependent receptor [Bryobacteraceae bacterium]